MKIKMIASDMDDTLLNNERKISPRNLAAIKRALAAGIVFTLATGRMYRSIKPFAEQLQLDVPLIAYNGALVKGALSEKVYVRKPMQLQTALVSFHCLLKKLPVYYVQVYIDDELLVKEENEYSRMYSRISGVPTTAVGEAVYHITKAPYKLILMTESSDFAASWQDVANRFDRRIDVTSSKDNFLELMEPAVNKWVAVKELAESFGIKPDEIMCIGDSNNDISMIANAGIGVAVANAKPQVQQAAKLITASNDNDGVALAIENILTRQAEINLQ